MSTRHVGLLGATSLVGEHLIECLTNHGWHITAFSRQPALPSMLQHPHVSWQLLETEKCDWTTPSSQKIPNWICVAPIWVLPDHFERLLAYGAQRIVALSSTSRYSKNTSSDPSEQEIARKLIQGEALLQTWANTHAIEYIVLRPTLIYGYGRDKNIAEIARFIQRFGFFPVFGTARGLRQPIHVDDVVSACFTALEALNLKNYSYNLAGAETLPYREMVKRIFEKLDRQPRLLTIPLWFFQIFAWGIRWLPRYRHITAAMAERMNQDLHFDCTDAQRDLHFYPKAFTLTDEDLRHTN